ncbi:FG-GAP-like repeat-containing protein [Nocardioides humi]|uniref:Repeat domain-containing protein n=1 Tax=Nocardioides humi TaxID=449461 RepID=A0ABN2AW76_9ACTN|nr:FG-GAP-like repeat-containing protein [Nocardioides humi]
MSNITPPGWYPDGDGWERRWDGGSWTDDRRRMAEPEPADEATRVRPQEPPTAPPAAQPTAQPTAPPAPAPAPAPAPGPPTAPRAGTPAPSPPGYGQVPHGSYGGQPAPHGPPTPPRRSRLGLWIALAVVLVLIAGAAGTLAALRPWEDDDRTAGDGGGQGDDPAAVAIQGDLDGDGHGDAVYYFYPDYDSGKKITATSNGEVFSTTEVAVEPYREPDSLFLDWDGDGVNEVLTWAFVDSANQLTLSSTESDFPGEQTFRLPLSSLKDYGLRIQVQAGDFDGDGKVDLAVAGPNDKAVDIQVLRGDGTGGFGDPVRWASIPNATIDATEIRSGDFDHDGDADLWTQLPSEKVKDEDYTGYYSGRKGYAMLTSTGSEFEIGAVTENSIYADEYLVGDVTGDGTISLVTVQARSYDEKVEVKVYDLAEGRPKEVAGFTGTSTIGQRSLQGAILSDVDGDGRGDIVFVVKAYKESKFTGVQVMRSNGSGFERATVWAETPPCDSDDCRIRFQGS